MKKPAGFTIVEILIVVFIMGILSAGGYPLLMGYAQEVRLEQEARSIYEDLCLTRETAITGGLGSSTVNFYHWNDNLAAPVSQYEMLDGSKRIRDPLTRDENVRVVLMDELDPVPGGRRWRKKLIATRSVCIIPTDPAGAVTLPASTTNPLIRTLEFGLDGLLAYPTVPSRKMSFYVKFNNPGTQLPVDEVGTWVIEIVATSPRIFIRREL